MTLSTSHHATAADPAHRVEAAPPAAPRLNRIAWLTIWSAFAIFVMLCAGTGIGAAWARSTARVGVQAEIGLATGTVLTQPRGFGIWNNVQMGHHLRSGDSLRTAVDSLAQIKLPDGSRLELFPETQVRFDTLQHGRFLPDVRITSLRVVQGVARLHVVPPSSPRTEFAVTFPWGTAALDPGSYVVRTQNVASELTTEDGGRALLLTPRQGTYAVGPQQRVMLEAGHPPVLLPAKQNLVYDGTFTLPLADSWHSGTDRKFRDGEDVLGAVDRVVTDGEPALYLHRTGSNGHWAETYARQYLEHPLAGYRSMKVRFDVKLVYQNVPGGGYRGSEYPFLVRLKFRTPRGEHLWVRGFYYQNDTGNPTDNGELVERGQWKTYESPNLIAEIPQASEAKLLAVELTASGHDYASYIRNVEVVTE